MMPVNKLENKACMCYYKYIMIERPFSIQRGVGNKTKDNELAFVRQLGSYAERVGVSLSATLGMTAVELVRRAEIRSLQTEHPQLNMDDLEDYLEIYKGGDGALLDSFTNVDIVGARLYEVENGVIWLGGELSEDSEDEMADERDTLADMLSEATGSTIELPERELFVNIGMVDKNAHVAKPLLDYVASSLPDSLFLYDVDIH